MRQTVLKKHKQTKACTNSLGHIELSVANELQQYYVGPKSTWATRVLYGPKYIPQCDPI